MNFCIVCDKFVETSILFYTCLDCRKELETFDDEVEDDGLDVVTLPGLTCSPTDAYPGTERKVSVLAYRYENGQELWNPDDITIARPVPVRIDTEGMFRAEKFANFLEHLRREIRIYYGEEKRQP